MDYSQYIVWFLQFLQIAIFVFAVFYLYYDWKLGVAAVPSSSKAVRKVAELLPDIGGREVVDLGSGWGGMAFAAARACPDKQVTGIEYSVMPYAWARLRQLLNPKLSNLRFIRGDLFAYDVSRTEIVFCYMPPEFMPKLAEKFAQLPKGAVIISNSAVADGMTPERSIALGGLLPETIHIYRVA